MFELVHDFLKSFKHENWHTNIKNRDFFFQIHFQISDRQFVDLFFK